MSVRITEADFQANKLDEAATMFRDAMNAAQQYEGFIRGMLVADRSTGKAFSITLWESEEAEEASRESLYQDQLARFARLFASKPTGGSYELLHEG